jgi:uncharacterized glyoxalase superfamily protein PhnB
MSIEFTHNTPVLPVTDVTAAQNFYRDNLGFQVDWCAGDTFGAVSHGKISIFFSKSQTPIPEFTLVLNTPDADNVFSECKTPGIDIVSEIATQPWGTREFTVRDLNGHLLRIGHVDESKANYSDFS